MKLKTLLVLVFCNLIWSMNPTMAKIVMVRFSAGHVAWLRYASSLVTFILVLAVLRRMPVLSSKLGGKFVFRASPRQWLLVVALGFLTFCFSPGLYMSGLYMSRATDSALIVVMEPLVAVIMAWLFLREKIHIQQMASFALSIVGFVLLSGWNVGQSLSGIGGRFWGNLIILVAIFGEGAYSVIGRRLLKDFSPTAIFGTGLSIGVAFLSATVLLFVGFPDLTALTPLSVLAVIWMGPIGTTFSYLYWMMALREASVADVVLTLFIQPIVGSLCGYAFLGERLSSMQALGGLIILLAVLGQTGGGVRNWTVWINRIGRRALREDNGRDAQRREDFVSNRK